MIEIGTIYKLQYKNCMDKPEWYFVVNEAKEHGKGYYNLCRTDFKLRGDKPSFTDLWVCSERYINQLLSSGEMEVV